jgi:LacI family transcriptional regulator
MEESDSFHMAKRGADGRPPRVTIQDVARLADVSVATVSAVVNGNVPVSEKRTERVRAAMAALRYQPDERARTLRTGRSRMLGVVIPDITNPFYPEMLREIEQAARAREHSVLLCDSNNDPEQERRHLEALCARRVDGALVACVDSKTSYDWLEPLGFPVVFFERYPFSGRYQAISTDHRAASYHATKHLIQFGHRRIAFFLTNPDLSSSSARTAGYQAAFSDAGIPMPADLLLTQVEGAQGGYNAMRRLCSQTNKDRRPTALLCTNSVLLLGAARAAREYGLECPRDISLICFDNPAWTEHFPPAITTLAQPKHDIARRAVDLLLARVEKKGEPLEESLLEWLKDELVVRESTGPAPAV